MSGCGRDIPFGGYAVRSRGETIRSRRRWLAAVSTPDPCGHVAAALIIATGKSQLSGGVRGRRPAGTPIGITDGPKVTIKDPLPGRGASRWG